MAEPFRSFPELRVAHAKLLTRLNPENTGQIEWFIDGAVQAGAFIESDTDRREAQSILDYWATELAGMVTAAANG